MEGLAGLVAGDIFFRSSRAQDGDELYAEPTPLCSTVMLYRHPPPCLIYSFHLRNSSGRTPCERIKRTLPSLKSRGAIGLAFFTIQRLCSNRVFQISSIL